MTALRVWAGGIVHESNSFSPIPTGLADFEPWQAQADAPARWPGHAEFLAVAQADGAQAVSGFFVGATPSAPVSAPVWQALQQQLLASLADAGPLDVVWLVLHGAQMAEGCDDCEGALLAAVRRHVGPRVTVGVLLDLHTNLSPAMLAHASFIVACREYPHIDLAARAIEAWPVLRDTALGRVRPVMAAVRVPAFGTFPTTEPPFDALARRLDALALQPRVLAASALHGFFGGDSAHLAASTLVVTNGDAALAQQLAGELAQTFLALVRNAPAGGLPLPDALDLVRRAPRGPVVLADRADNAGGGAAGDGTVVMAALLERLAREPAAFSPAALALLWDPQAAELAHRAGLGATLAIRLGGKTGPMSGAPLDLLVTVQGLRDDATQPLFGDGAPLVLGRAAVLRWQQGGAWVDVVVNSVRQQVFSPQVFSAFGLDPAAYRLLVVKSTQHFHAGFAPLAAEVVRCDAPGTVCADVTQQPYTRLARPMWPWDADARCTPLVATAPEPAGSTEPVAPETPA